MKSYLFYDLETTGLNFAFDQVLQFAAIRTDRQFNEIERHEIRVRLRPDVIPSPEATLSHAISLDTARSGECEVEATREIHRLLNEPGTISLGYNTLGFDDEFLRFAFHRNLLPPYTHQYASECGRMDLLPFVTLYWVHMNHILEWPEVDGRISLKLENLKEVNFLFEGTSHDALVDVQTTIELAKKLAQEADMWNYIADHFKKGVDMSRILKLPPISAKLDRSYKYGLLVSNSYRAETNFQVPVIYIGRSVPYENQYLWMRLDLPELLTTSPTDIDETTWVIRKKFGQPGIILPPLERFLDKIDSQREEILQSNIAWLEENPNMLKTISKYHCEFSYPEVPNIDADAMLYQMDFLSDADVEKSRAFHLATLDDKPRLCNNFESVTIRELSKRILFRNYAEKTGDEIDSAWSDFRKTINPASRDKALVDYRGRPRMTPLSCLQEIKRIREEVTLSRGEKRLLRELEKYITERFIVLRLF